MRALREPRVASALVALVAVAAGIPAAFAAVPAAAQRRVPAVAWRSCAGKFRCTTVTVPLAYSQPSAGTIGLAVAELPASGPNVLGDLFMNPGGPGASGVQFLEQAATGFPAAVRQSFNLVSWDPRGVGASAPVHCVSAAETRKLLALSPAPSTPAQIAATVAATKSYVAGCVAHTSLGVLQHVSTFDTARDLDRLRAALGDAKLTYLGFSYGTFIGEVYAKLFPSHVRALVLDGAIDPALSTVAEDTAQAVGFETDLKAFFAYCDSTPACEKQLPGGAAAQYRKLFRNFAHGGSVVASFKAVFGGTQQVGLGLAEVGVISALYTQQTWAQLGQALGQALKGNGNLLAALAYGYEGLQQNGQFSNENDANSAINCVDRPSPKSLGVYESLAKRLAKLAPDFGAATAWGSLACAYWPVAPQSSPGAIHAPRAPPIVVVGSTGDPATPYAWAQAVASELARGVLLTRTGPGHTGYFSSSCVQQAVDTYLLDLTTPAAGTVCPSN